MKTSLNAIFVLLLFLVCNSIFAQLGPGSGKAGNFTGSNYINIPNSASFLHSANTLTVEAWIYPTAYPNPAGSIVSKAFTDGSREYYYYLLPNGKIFVGIFNNTATNFLVTSINTINLNTWSHVAFSYNGATGIVSIYINGVLDSNTNIGIVTMAQTTTNPLIGATWLTPPSGPNRDFFIGLIDEVRIWDVIRTQTQIQTNMCHNLVGNEAGLNAYYPLDEMSGSTTADLTSNANTGTLTNFTPAEITSRSYSGAPVGNVSVNYYLTQPANWTGQTYTLNSTTPTPAAPIDARSLTIDNITGTPDGIHIYRVNSLPSQTGGLIDPLKTYFGTFVANVNTPGTAFSYRATYDYTPYGNSSCKSSFALKTRNDNSVANWANIAATNNTTNYTLTSTNNLIRREFILDTTCILPVEMVAYNIYLTGDDKVDIQWSTAKEKNNYAFYIERSSDGSVFETIGDIKSQNGQSNITQQYAFIDSAPVQGISYYRIKQTDIDGYSTYFPIIPIANNTVNNYVLISPNPSTNHFNIQTNIIGSFSIQLIDMNGRIIYYSDESSNGTFSKQVNTSTFGTGVYGLTLTSTSDKITKKIIIE